MAEEIGFENGRNSNFEGLVTLTLTLDRAIRHTVVHHSSTSTYIPNFIQIEETFVDGRTDVRKDGHFSPYIIRSTFGSRPNYNKLTISTSSSTNFGQSWKNCPQSPHLESMDGDCLIQAVTIH